MSIGKKLLELRQRKGLSQEDLANQLHVSRQTISKWESDLSLPDMKIMLEIAEFYDVAITELLGVDEKEQSQESVEHIYEQTSIVLENIQKETKKRKTRDIIILCAICITCFISICFAVVLSIKVIELQNRPVINNQYLTTENPEESLIDSFEDGYEKLIYDFDKDIITVNYKCILKQYTNKTTVKLNMTDVNNKEYQYNMKKVNDSTFVYNEMIPLIDYKSIKAVVNLGDGIEKSENLAIYDYYSNVVKEMIHLSMPKDKTNHLVKNQLDFYTDFSRLENNDVAIQYKGLLKGTAHVEIYKENGVSNELIEIVSQDVSLDKKTAIHLNENFGNKDRIHYVIKINMKGCKIEFNGSKMLIEDTNQDLPIELINEDSIVY